MRETDSKLTGDGGLEDSVNKAVSANWSAALSCHASKHERLWRLSVPVNNLLCNANAPLPYNRWRRRTQKQTRSKT